MSSDKIKAMDIEEAKEIFRLAHSFDKDDLQDAYEESFFSTRDYFLKNTVIPQLFVSRLQRLRKFEEAFRMLIEEPFEWESPELHTPPGMDVAAEIIDLTSNTLEELLKTYEAKLTEKRMLVAQSWTIPDVVYSTLRLVEVQQAYHVLFEIYGKAEVRDSDLDFDNVKASQQVDSGLLLKQLKNRGTSKTAESEFQESLRKELARVKKLNRLLKTSAGDK